MMNCLHLLINGERAPLSSFESTRLRAREDGREFSRRHCRGAFPFRKKTKAVSQTGASTDELPRPLLTTTTSRATGDSVPEVA